MKTLYLNRFQRESIYLKTSLGTMLTLNIALKKFSREIFRSFLASAAWAVKQLK